MIADDGFGGCERRRGRDRGRGHHAAGNTVGGGDAKRALATEPQNGSHGRHRRCDTTSCDPTPICRIVSVASNEPVNGAGDGNTAPDWEITGALTVNLRAERSGQGVGRLYTITVRCVDLLGERVDD